MTGFVYKWTNQVNGKWYIGSRKGTIDDGYRHSSRIVGAAEKKYGIENFTREILFEGKKGLAQQSVTCLHCNKTGGISGMYRYHFTNCKTLTM